MAIVLREVVDDPMVSRAEESFFLELFNNVLMLVNGQRATDEEIRAGIERVVGYFREIGPSGACAVNNFSKLGDYLGYFYWSSPLSASVTRRKALAAIRNCPDVRSCFDQSSLKMISVGAGTGGDLVGLYSALYEAGCTFRNMEITLTDINMQWLPLHDAVQKYLKQNQFGNASRLIQSRSINTSFICADLLNAIPANLQQELRNANLIWMKGLRSILGNDGERHKVIENIVPFMSPGALFVVFDPLYFDNFERMGYQRLQRIFSTSENYGYVLQPFGDQQYKYRFCEKTNQEIIIFKKV